MSVAVVVPCFNEAGRLDGPALAKLAATVDQVVFVDDGSTDATADQLARIAGRDPGRIQVVRLEANRGKGEAVRAGLRQVDGLYDVYGYFDADLATPVAEFQRLLATLDGRPDCVAVMASRVALLGHSIDRRAARHYLGRVYSTGASLVLGLPVYDTQCGAKVFRASPTFTAALATPFPDRWSFDVELLARLLRPGPGLTPVEPWQLIEMPLREWRDVAGSKLRAREAVRSLAALAGVRRRMRQRT